MDLRELPTSHAFARHPWEIARAAFFGETLAALARGGPAHVLDVGAGDGYVGREVLARLPPGTRVVCYDAHYSDAHLARGAADAPPALSFTRDRPGDLFDVLLLLDVVEHVDDDAGFVRDLVARNLRPGGRALVSVPAWMPLYCRHDVVLGHRRRYRPAELRALLEGNGLTFERGGGLFHALIVPRALAKLAELGRGVHSRPDRAALGAEAETGLSRWRRGRLVTAAVLSALRADNALSRACAAAGVALPGLSAWALARKA
jgi:SAM-dependent methyltransferase